MVLYCGSRMIAGVVESCNKLENRKRIAMFKDL